jgi:hypothetical protein
MRRKNKIESQVHLLTVPNNADGNALIRALRGTIKASKTGRRLILYGRGHRFGKGRIKKDAHLTGNFDNSFQSHVPLTVAQNIAVYVMG